ncbi:MAG TPA: TetR/AcrR family transcriptional regulator [Cyclobacteriaceae bacterium]|nr:TetR/AcrR family transcriptional regulator [Cyclobacteriaceae bacterium]
MLTKSERTRQFIIEQAAPIFNRKGFAGTSMSDILEATGLAKGGLYGNFESKEEIAREAFRYSFEKVYTEIVKAVTKKKSPLEKLIAVCDYHKDYTKKMDGGCPILNFSIEVDDTMPRLKKDVRMAVELMLSDLHRIIEKGKRLGEIKREINSERFAGVIYAQIEGAIFMAKALDDHRKLNQSLDFLKNMILSELKA